MITKTERANQEKLRLNKPYVYEKMMKFPALTQAGKSIAIIQLQYNYACNFKCQHCSIHNIQQQGIRYKKPRLTIPDIKELSRQADALGLARFEINGGEPLINKDFDELVQAIDPAKFYINCVTNAWYLSARAHHLQRIGIDRIQVGLDSLDASAHDQFRHKSGAHARCLAGIDRCLEIGLEVFVTTVVTKQRLYDPELIEFIKFFNNKGVGVFMTYAKPVGSWENHFDILLNREDLKFAEKLEAQYNTWSHLTPGYGRDRGCLAVQNLIAITPYGDVLPCQYIFIGLGNILKESLENILDRGMQLSQFRTDICPIANDRNFIDTYIVDRVYGQALPVPYEKVFK